MNKPVYLGLPLLELCKMFRFDHLKPKFDEKAKFCYMNADIFIVYLKADYIYKEIAENVESRSDTSSYELDRPLPKEN